MSARIPAPQWRLAFAIVLLVPCLHGCGGRDAAGTGSSAGSAPAARTGSVELSEAQLRSVSVQDVTEHAFTPACRTEGSIDFDRDRAVQVSPPWAGRIVQAPAQAGDRVRKGQLLFTLESPDLVQAESTLIAAAGQLRLASGTLARARVLSEGQGIPKKELEQAQADEQAAEAAWNAARGAVRIFGRSDAQIDRIVAGRGTDPQLRITSPIDGVVVARNAAPGALVQPGTAPYTVADVASKWLLAQVPESDLPALHAGQPVDVTVTALPGRVFQGRIAQVSEELDPDTRRAAARARIEDPADELRARMLASFTVYTGAPAPASAVPDEAVVREGDGSLSVWVADGARRFTRRTVRIGMRQDGLRQVLEGLRPGERVATTGAVFISNAAAQQDQG